LAGLTSAVTTRFLDGKNLQMPDMDGFRAITAGFDGSASRPIYLPEPSLFHPEALDESCAGMIEIILEVLEAFLKQGPSDIDRIVAALAGGDLPSARRASHGLKGACLTVGAEILAAACQRIESLDENAPIPVAAAVHDALAGDWGLLRAAIECHCQALGLANAAG
jgi:HPt (histidine-containing phosphotransfer) domain-containing protein